MRSWHVWPGRGLIETRLTGRGRTETIEAGLTGKVVLITGANHGIGAATARAFASQGARAAITYYREPPRYSEEEMRQAREAGIGGEPLYHAMQQTRVEPLLAEIRA